MLFYLFVSIKAINLYEIREVNLLTHSIRNLHRNALYSCLHLVGLGVSLAAVFFIFLWVRDELSTDRYHSQIADTYVLVDHETNYGIESYEPYVPRPLIHAVKEELPEVKEACAVRRNRSVSFLEYDQHKFFNNRILNVDTSLFRIFDYTFIEGDLQRAFLDNSSVVLTEPFAKKLFGDRPAFGEMILAVNSDGSSRNYQVSAVVATPKEQSMIKFDALFPAAPDVLPNAWYSWSNYGFLLLHSGSDVAQMGEKILETYKNRYYPEADISPFILFPLSKYHLYNLDGSGGRIVVVRLFVLMGFVLLLMACVNYVNLVTARAQKRSKEISIKKSIGATRVKLLQQLPKKAHFRTLLVVFQFCCSIVFIVAMLGMGAQFRYMQKTNVDNRTKDIFTEEFDLSEQISTHLESFLSDLKNEPSIAGVAVSHQHIMDQGEFTDGIEWEGMDPENNGGTNILIVNSDFPELMDLTFVQGSGFTGSPADSSRILLNETAVKRMGIEDPIGKRFTIWDRTCQITGVLKDFHFQHMKEAIEPLVVFLWGEYLSVLYVKAQPDQHAEALAAVEKVWRRYDPDYPINARFMSDTFANIYREDKQMTRLFNLFAALAVLISCLGLFGLVTFTAETRTKEIGIRKVMGARVGQIVYMLSKEFLILAGIAMAIAFPIAYYWLNRMLQEYAYRINMSWLLFALAALITMGITLITVSWQAIKAATANPVDSIKIE